MGVPPVMAQMVRKFSEFRTSIVAVQDVPRGRTQRDGIVCGPLCSEYLLDMADMIGKPLSDRAPTTLAETGRTRREEED